MTAGITARRRPVPKRTRSSIGFFSALLVFFGGGCALVGAVAVPGLNGGAGWLYWSTTFDVLNNFLPVWAGLIALGLLLALLRRRTSRVFMWLAGLLLLISLAPIGWELLRAPERIEYGPAANPARAIRVIQFNAMADNADPDAILALVLERDVDLVMIEEPGPFRRLEPFLLARYPFQTPCPSNRCRAIIYSRVPPLEADYASLTGDWYPDEFAVQNGEIGVAMMRLIGPDGAPFSAVATHFRWPYPPLPVLHQRDVFLDHIANVDRTRAIVAGDFNLTPWTHQMRGFDAEITPMQRVTRALFTYPTPFLSPELPLPFAILPIDHVYAGSRWRLVNVERGPVSGSDHYPVIVELVMPEEPDGS